MLYDKVNVVLMGAAALVLIRTPPPLLMAKEETSVPVPERLIPMPLLILYVIAAGGAALKKLTF